MAYFPEILRFKDGTKLEDKNQWALRREELIDILSSEEYGYLPEAKPVSIKSLNINKGVSAGRAFEEKLMLSIQADKGEFELPITFLCPSDEKKHPLFVYLSFNAETYQHYLPAETVLKNGFAVAIIHYTAVTSDDNDMQNALAGMMNRNADGTGWGKLSLWAWAASRALDALIVRSEIDKDNIAVIGHSRLGKTALWCGANDERFRFVCVNDSGCSGAAMERCKNPESETAEKIYRRFPFWFCENYKKYGDRVEEMPFDQHMAIAACCPRFVAVASASEDAWADPASEMRSCIVASEAWKFMGLDGLKEGVSGHVAYYLRDGVHFLSIYDWEYYMSFIKAHLA